MVNPNIIKKATVLVVDTGDNTLSREVSDILDGKVKSVHIAKTQSEAIYLFAKISPQIVMFDSQHSSLNIIDFVSELRRLNSNAEVVVTTGFVEPLKLLEFVDMGIHKFVIKPITMPKLVDTINKAMESVVEKVASSNAKYMFEVLNAEDTPVFSTDGRVVVKANKAFLDCFGARSLSQFCSTYTDLKSAFGADDENSEEWFNRFLQTSDEPKVSLYDNRLGEQRLFLFRMGSRGFDKNNFVVTMTDITDIEASFEKKIEMLSSQVLSKDKLRFRYMLELEVARCKRYKKIFSLIVGKFDLRDDFALEEWDEIFKIIRHALRSTDIFSKIDNNQIAIIATETDINGANIVVDRLKKEFEKLESDNEIIIGYKGCAAEFDEQDSVQSIFKRAMDCLI